MLNERIHDPAYHVTPEFLRNAWNSYSYEFGCYLREFCEALSGDPQFHFKAARVRKVPQIIQILLRPFSTQQSYRMWAYVGQKYTKGVLEFGVGNVTNRSAILRMRFTEKAFASLVPIGNAVSMSFASLARPGSPEHNSKFMVSRRPT